MLTFETKEDFDKAVAESIANNLTIGIYGSYSHDTLCGILVEISTKGGDKVLATICEFQPYCYN